jgi:hypothetical protein
MRLPAKERRIRAFKSFEEAQAYEDEYAANQDPLERMAATLRVIKAIYNYKPGMKKGPRSFVMRRLY